MMTRLPAFSPITLPLACTACPSCQQNCSTGEKQSVRAQNFILARAGAAPHSTLRASSPFRNKSVPLAVEPRFY